MPDLLRELQQNHGFFSLFPWLKRQAIKKLGFGFSLYTVDALLRKF
jgi:hypothetical protein